MKTIENGLILILVGLIIVLIVLVLGAIGAFDRFDNLLEIAKRTAASLLSIHILRVYLEGIV